MSSSVASIVLPPLHEHTLGNGARIVVARRQGVPLVAVRLVLAAGASLDPERGHGLANLVALTARRGTARHSGRAIDDRVESLGSELGAGVDEDAAYFGLSSPSEFLRELLDVVVEVATVPTFPSSEWERVRRREVAGFAHVMDEPGAVADRAMIRAVFEGHPYGHPTDGSRAHVQRLRRADAVAFQKRWFAPESAILVIVGAIDPERALAAARSKLSRWSPRRQPAPEIPEAPTKPRGVLVVDKPELTQVQLRIAVPALARSTPEYFPAVVANAVFGGGFSARLMQAVRVNRGLSYGARSRFAMSRATGFFFMSSFTKVETTTDLLDVALDEAGRFCDDGPSAEELTRAQSYLSGLYPMALETHDQVADRLVDAKIHGTPMEEITDYRSRIAAVTAEQCREVARRHFPIDRGVIVAVGPAKRIAGPLERFGPVEVVPARSVV